LFDFLGERREAGCLHFESERLIERLSATNLDFLFIFGKAIIQRQLVQVCIVFLMRRIALLAMKKLGWQP
jgi:hypothetical protein